MDRAFETGAVVVAPSVPAVPSVGHPTGGNPLGGVPATKPGPYWFHMITEELRAVIVAAGLTPNLAVVDQVLQALPLALASRPEMARSLGASGYQRIPGGLILQWVTGASSTAGEVAETVTLPIAFPVLCLMALPGTLVSSGAAAADTWYQIVSFTSSQVTVLRNQSSVNAVAASPLIFAIGR